MKIKLYNGLQFRLTMSFVILILLIAGFSYYYTYHEAKNAIKQTTREQLLQASAMAASQFDDVKINILTSFKEGDEKNPAYKTMNEFVYKLRRDCPDLNNIYIMKMEDKKILFLLDDFFITKPDEKAMINEEYTDYDDKLLDAFNGQVSASEDFYTDKWGTFLSGYAPIKNSYGEQKAVLGIDMVVGKAVEKQNFIGSIIYLIMGIAIFAAALIILFFSTTIIKDINKMTRVAEELSRGNIYVELPDIKSKNEIANLNEAMKSMMAAVELLMDIAKKAESSKNKGGY